MTSERNVRTGAWYGDQSIRLDFPNQWDVTFLWPKTPPPLTDEQIVNILTEPVGQPPIKEMCRGKTRPLIIVDDLNRPTPATRVMPFLLNSFREAGIPLRKVRILMAPGTHGPPREYAMLKKVGSEAATSCQVLVHDCTGNVVKIGRTSFGTPVIVNREVAESDFLIGVGGIYPNYTAGFGGGSKLALGVLGKRSIVHLHYGHRGAGRASLQENDFRSDLDEIAQMIGLNTTISLHVNADREIVRVTCGDYSIYYKDAVAFSKEAFSAPMPGDADVVISNAYPIDTSLTFVQMKGMAPLADCASDTSKIAVGSCSEGMGYHGLFPFPPTRFHRVLSLARGALFTKRDEIAVRIVSLLNHSIRSGVSGKRSSGHGTEKRPIWLYRPGKHQERLPLQIRNIRIRSSWSEVVQAVQKEQANKTQLRVLVYACAPLQCLDPSRQSF